MILESSDERGACQRRWSAAASLVLGMFLFLGAVLLASGHAPGSILCFGLAATYVPIRLARGHRLAAGGGHGRG